MGGCSSCLSGCGVSTLVAVIVVVVITLLLTGVLEAPDLDVELQPVPPIPSAPDGHRGLMILPITAWIRRG